MLRLDPNAPVRPLYEQLLAREPEHPEALAGMAAILGPDEQIQRQQYLQLLWQTSAQYRQSAAESMVEMLQAQASQAGYDAQALRLWRERAREAAQADAQIAAELADSPVFSHTTRHDLSAFELTELRADLALYRPITQAWLLGVQVPGRPSCRAFLLLVASPVLGAEERSDLRTALQAQLDLPGPLMVCSVGVGEAATEEETRRHAKEPVYTA